jgi:DNA (cytosine-5)-methyltransferase 1
MNFVDLFSGIGGLSLGLERAGLRCVGALDNWKVATETFAANHPNRSVICGDITELTASQFLERIGVSKYAIDGIVGGPPCQGFSTMGKRLEEDPRNSLWVHFLSYVEHIRPRFVVIENVEGLAVMAGGKFPSMIQSSLEDLGYNAKWDIVYSADYGVPQLRKRFLMIAILEGQGTPSLPPPSHCENGSMFGEKPWVSVADAISDLPALTSGEAKKQYILPPQTDYQIQMRGNSNDLLHHEAAKHPPHLVKIVSFIPDGGNRKSIPDQYQPKSGFHNSYARLASWKPAMAVTSNMRKPSSARATHPFQDRGLTVREGMRLQSFPDSFHLCGSRSTQYLQVGNAVPPRLGEALGRHLIKIVSHFSKKVAV